MPGHDDRQHHHTEAVAVLAVFHLGEVGKLNSLALELTPRRLARASELRIARASALLWRSSWLALVGRGLAITVRRSPSKTD
jgi:hypothetical protein